MPGNIFRNLVLKFDIDIFKIIAEIAFCTKKFFFAKRNALMTSSLKVHNNKKIKIFEIL